MKLLCGFGVAVGCVAGMMAGFGGGVACAHALQQSQTSPRPAETPDEPVDPDSTAGVRGGGPSVRVEVQYRRKAVAGASVVAKNPDGRVAGTCNTDSAGVCALGIGAGDYMLTATQSGLAGTTPAEVTAASKPIAIKLVKEKTVTK
jgi:hypothetical protein